jgi:hypothetical protein
MPASPSPLVEVAPDLHTATSEMRFPGGVRLPVRMTVVRLPGGELVVHSPIAAEPGLLDAVGRLGPVRYVVAPSCIHHVFVGPWCTRFPSATAHGAPGLRNKRPDLVWGADLALDGGVGAPWSASLDSVLVGGTPRINEVVFHHRPTRTLLVSDLLFNVTGPINFPTRLLLTLAGTRGRLAMSRIWRLSCRGQKHRWAMRDSVQRILVWPFVRILPGHGALFEAPDAQQQARQALAWALA